VIELAFLVQPQELLSHVRVIRQQRLKVVVEWLDIFPVSVFPLALIISDSELELEQLHHPSDVVVAGS
jgi:hypothetical protein